MATKDNIASKSTYRVVRFVTTRATLNLPAESLDDAIGKAQDAEDDEWLEDPDYHDAEYTAYQCDKYID